MSDPMRREMKLQNDRLVLLDAAKEAVRQMEAAGIGFNEVGLRAAIAKAEGETA